MTRMFENERQIQSKMQRYHDQAQHAKDIELALGGKPGLVAGVALGIRSWIGSIASTGRHQAKLPGNQEATPEIASFSELQSELTKPAVSA